MPLYEYLCASCGISFEVIQKFSDEPLTVHEGCGGTVERLISPSAFQFKGTGWYVTDYARKNNSGANGKNAETKSTSPAKSESKGETATKPAPASSGKQ